MFQTVCLLMVFTLCSAQNLPKNYFLGYSENSTVPKGFELMKFEDVKSEAFVEHYRRHGLDTYQRSFMPFCCMVKLAEDQYLFLDYRTMMVPYTSSKKQVCQSPLPAIVFLGGGESDPGKFQNHFINDFNETVLEALRVVDEKSAFGHCKGSSHFTYALYKSVEEYVS
eukprot:m.69557 g.69557  ORF g.69557 m.69557 type:complete len:168 (+) comp12067_c1_seq1:95-598(+)